MRLKKKTIIIDFKKDPITLCQVITLLIFAPNFLNRPSIFS